MRAKLWAGVVALGAMSGVTGCGGFFPPLTSTTSTASTTGDYVYVVNLTTNTLAGFTVGTNAVTAISGSPFALTTGLSPSSAVVSRADTFVYVGGNGAVECYSIGPAGALTQVSGGGATVTGDVVSMATSPDGQWLIVLYYSTTTLATQAAVYGINATSGVLTLASAATVTFPSNYTFGTLAPKIIKISPAGNYIAAALGTAGDAFFSFNTTTGVLVQTGNVIPAQNSGTFLSDNAVQFDSASGYLFVGTTGLASGGSYITVYPISSSGALGTSSTITAGDSPSSLEFDSTGTYLYSANRGSANISGYTFSGGKLAAISGSPFGASTQVDALVRDKSGNYIFAAASSGGSTGANDVTMYGFDAYTSGKLDEVAVTASGTDPAGSVAIAATH